MDYLEWDINTITAGDYSVEYMITEGAYEWFNDNVY